MTQKFFNCILHKDQYVYIENAKQYIQNLLIVSTGKSKDQVLVLSSDPF